jgi:hypothetical protein
VFSTGGIGTTGNIATGDAVAVNTICTGATTCAEDSRNPGIVALRSQQGAPGAEAGAAPRAVPEFQPCVPCFIAPCFIAQCAAQRALAAGAGEMQRASPSAGAKSTVRSNPDATSLRICILFLYTKGKFHPCDFYHSCTVGCSHGPMRHKKPHAFAQGFVQRLQTV